MAFLPMTHGGGITPFKLYLVGYGSGDLWYALHDLDKNFTKVKLISSTSGYTQFRYYVSQGATQTVISMTSGNTYNIPSTYYDGTNDSGSGLIFVGGPSQGAMLLEFS